MVVVVGWCCPGCCVTQCFPCDCKAKVDDTGLSSRLRPSLVPQSVLGRKKEEEEKQPGVGEVEPQTAAAICMPSAL